MQIPATRVHLHNLGGVKPERLTHSDSHSFLSFITKGTLFLWNDTLLHRNSSLDVALELIDKAIANDETHSEVLGEWSLIYFFEELVNMAITKEDSESVLFTEYLQTVMDTSPAAVRCVGCGYL